VRIKREDLETLVAALDGRMASFSTAGYIAYRAQQARARQLGLRLLAAEDDEETRSYNHALDCPWRIV
jgi:hypothetical protein